MLINIFITIYPNNLKPHSFNKKKTLCHIEIKGCYTNILIRLSKLKIFNLNICEPFISNPRPINKVK